LNDTFMNLVFNPARIGIGNTYRMTGAVAARSLSSKELDALLKPSADAPKSVDEMSAAEYREAHRDDFANPEATEMEQRYWEFECQKFLENEPSYIPTIDNRQMLVKFINDSGLKLNQGSLMHAFNELTKSGRMKKNEAVDVRVGSTRRVDFAG
jgi:hypothetical protein